MINRDKRDHAITLIKDFLDCKITNDDFVEFYPIDKEDRALSELEYYLWFYYDDLSNHKLEGPYQLSEEEIMFFNRCILFLSTNLEYEWPNHPPNFYNLLLTIISFGKFQNNSMDNFKQCGDFDAWPFIRKSDYKYYLENSLTLD